MGLGIVNSYLAKLFFYTIVHYENLHEYASIRIIIKDSLMNPTFIELIWYLGCLYYHASTRAQSL